MGIFDVGHNGRGHFNLFDLKVKSKKDKRSIFEIHFLFKYKYGYDSFSSQELHAVGIFCIAITYDI